MIHNLKPYPAYKDSGVEWLGDVRVHWKVLRIRNAVDMRVSNVDKHTKKGELPIRLCNYVDVYKNDRITEQISFMRATASMEEIERFRLEKGDVLLTKDSEAWNDIGVPALVEDAVKDLVSGYHLALLRPRKELLSGAYLLRALQCSTIAHQFHVAANGVTRYGLSHRAIKSVLLPLPPLSEQQRIATFLDREITRIDALIEKKQRQIELLQEKRTALISRAVTKGLDPNAKMKPSGVEWLGEIPAHWGVKRLKHVTKCLDGKRVPLNSEQRGEKQGDIPYWGANGVLDYLDEFLFDEPLVLLGEDGAPFFDRLKDVAFYVMNKVWVNNHAHVLRPVGIEPVFLAHALNMVEYRSFIDGTTRDKLTQDDMNQITIQAPPVDEQRAIAAFLDRETVRVDALIEKVEKSIALLREYRTALISAAVTGKIDVRKEST